jgi:hypothetical protein
VAGQPPDGHHADPVVHGIQASRCIVLDEVAAQRANLRERLRVIEGQQVVRSLGLQAPVYVRKTVGDGVDSGRREPRPDQTGAQRVDVRPHGAAAHQGRLERGGAPAHEGVVDGVPWLGQPLDEIGRQLGLEAGAVADLVQGVRLTLPGCPELALQARRCGADAEGPQVVD